jgi:multidrug efflux pump subunit AcrB
MWLVKIALRTPYTFTILAVLLLIGGALSPLQLPKDIFPAINIPVVGVIWTFNGMPVQELESRITTVSERALTTTVNNIERELDLERTTNRQESRSSTKTDS